MLKTLDFSVETKFYLWKPEITWTRFGVFLSSIPYNYFQSYLISPSAGAL